MSADLDFEGDANDAAPEADSLARVARLSELLARQDAEVVAAELALRKAKEARERTASEDLPQLMAELGLKELKLEDGSSVGIEDFIACAIKDENRAEAVAWLRARDYDGILKTELSLSFARGEDADLDEVVQTIEQAAGRSVEVVSGVHPQTLKAFIKERIAAGEFTDEVKRLFSVFRKPVAVLTQPKKKRGKKVA